ncbi:MAG: DNA mismatch endonuclease Vsr [Phycisphaeraceae bacterium]|nr:DNA mismatch endonuclease Vsr [Phycisphaerae bacterium]MBX3391071.1 DNA mismatch endonuclease Vsr [Phycisphaeraceae bacterium]
MARVKGRDTGPERVVGEILRAFRFRPVSHPADVPGKPDLVFRSRRAVVFVHGCFWHRHSCRNGQRLPKTRLEFWGPKLEGNRLRDARTRRRLRADGWRVLVVWECQTRNAERLRTRLAAFLAKCQGALAGKVSSKR